SLLEIWDGRAWTLVTAITATRRRRNDPEHGLLPVQARAGCVEVTAHHNMLDADRERIAASEVQPGDELALCDEMPPAPEWTVATTEMAELLGLMAADGYVEREGKGAHFTNDDLAMRIKVATLWARVFLGSSAESTGTSGWDVDATVERVNLNGNRHAAG